MTEQTRKLVLTASILATSVILVFFQAPFLGMGMDISYVAILIGRRYIGFWWTIGMCAIFPWISMGFMGPIGALFIVLQSMGIVCLDKLFNKDDSKLEFFGIAMVVLLGTLLSAIINFIIIVPMYWFLADNTFGNFFGNYSDMNGEFLKYELSWMITGLVFNPIKLSIVYGIFYGIWIALENSVNQEPITSIKSNKEDVSLKENKQKENKVESKDKDEKKGSDSIKEEKPKE